MCWMSQPQSRICCNWTTAGVVDIGGGTTGIAIVKKGKVTYSADEATGGHHISLTLAGNRRISLEEAEQYKRGHGEEIWPAVKPAVRKNGGHCRPAY